MAKKSLIARNEKRIKLANALFARRIGLKRAIACKNIDLSERYALVKQLSNMPRNGTMVRVRNRCEITGRPRGVYSKFTLCRHKIRELAGQSLLPGLVKSSW